MARSGGCGWHLCDVRPAGVWNLDGTRHRPADPKNLQDLLRQWRSVGRQSIAWCPADHPCVCGTRPALVSPHRTSSSAQHRSMRRRASRHPGWDKVVAIWNAKTGERGLAAVASSSRSCSVPTASSWEATSLRNDAGELRCGTRNRNRPRVIRFDDPSLLHSSAEPLSRPFGRAKKRVQDIAKAGPRRRRLFSIELLIVRVACSAMTKRCFVLGGNGPLQTWSFNMSGDVIDVPGGVRQSAAVSVMDDCGREQRAPPRSAAARSPASAAVELPGAGRHRCRRDRALFAKQAAS